ncbi:phosphoribosyltransferase [Nitratireductor sp. CH_MIT9313-5]|jgi:predicted amidophosphoribosyltransferase|uniref:phosphoribosyltransferase n=1 Tax=Nitratireductor sp. CH_MIT9313-5 TaxID=3107764 RepID=UPI0030093E96
MGQATQWFLSEQGYTHTRVHRCPEKTKLFREYHGAPDPNFLFLEQTLLRRMKVHKRGQVAYFSVRAWRQSVRELQLKAMRNLKRSPSEESAKQIAREIAEAAMLITNGAAFDCVCPVPAGSSGKTNNFATIISWYVSKELELAHYQALENVTVAKSYGSSHPQQSRHFRSRVVDHRVRNKMCLLIDDVATTGTHFARCVGQLAKHDTSTICITWIG